MNLIGIYTDRWMNERMNSRMNELVDEWIERIFREDLFYKEFDLHEWVNFVDWVSEFGWANGWNPYS